VARDTPRLYSSCTPDWGQEWNVGINEDTRLDDSKWERWLRSVTRERSVRGIARATGRSHTTVQRWITNGVPVQTVWELTLRFRADPVRSLIMLGRLTPEEVPQLNWAEIVRYAPAEVLTAELHGRTVTALRARPEVDPKRQASAV